jgi:hypothetical protein
MTEHFGSAYAESFARDHVVGLLGGRTVEEALESGESPKDVWRAVCVDQDVPARLR